ncbi:hypothetical protein DNFV4_02555 [Nitrospira tepida]|uniref:Uncharacterized protein n=1 Tax=Nitrospira tepida TaxID=2973512 RepID=A0AA86MZU9_9BACT|nr:hypothetical protein [Nitrospira tepida]CAI4032128.1 hypothetical protein DNFV4_02555 [Nitrospira tepida]
MEKQSRNKTPERTPSPLDLLPPEPLLEQYEKAIGSLVMRLSLSHFILEAHLCFLIGIDLECGRVLTEDLPLKSLINRVGRAASAKLRQPEDIRTLKAILKGLDAVNDKRNRLVHALWYFTDRDQPFFIPKKGKPVDQEAPSVEEVKKLVDAVETLLNDLLNFVEKQKSRNSASGLNS